MSIYNDWGFSDNPFKGSALPASELGKELLVGRVNEVEKILRRLYNPPAAVTIEGLNGVGKTSLLNVSIYDAYLDFFNSKTKTLYIPCRKVFQLDPNKSIESFLDELFLEIAQTLIKRSEELKILGYPLPQNCESIERWLNSPYISTYQATFGSLGVGKNTETNTSNGFEKSGFRHNIINWLQEIFPNSQDGAVVCIIDNLELLETSDQAKKLLEQLRDEAFNIIGLRWVMCGALGIINSIASTPRLEGYLHKPIEIEGINKKFSKDIFEKRAEYYSQGSTPYLPMTSSSFELIHEILNSNLRNSLHYCNEYCLTVADSGNLPLTDAEKENCFLKWIQTESINIYDDVKSQIRPRAWQLFKDVVIKGGVFSPSDYEGFGFNSISALRPHVLELEKVSLLISTIDESDNRRKTIQVTPKGCFTVYAKEVVETPGFS